MNLVTRSTKTNCIVASVMTALLMITLIMLSSLMTISSSSKVLMCLIYTVSLMFILLLWEGALQIKVFNDYKSKNSLLCADGVVSLCMGALLIICSVLFGAIQASKVFNGILLTSTDIRVFLTVFLAVIGIWKSILCAYSIKRKEFNWWCEAGFAVLWLSLSIMTLVSMYVPNLTSIAWLIISFGWALIVLNLFYMNYSYVLRNPEYLLTQEAIEIHDKEIADKKRAEEVAIAKENRKLGIKTNKDLTIKEKLRKLKDLRDLDLITEENYQEKKSEILEDF